MTLEVDIPNFGSRFWVHHDVSTLKGRANKPVPLKPSNYLPRDRIRVLLQPALWSRVEKGMRSR